MANDTAVLREVWGETHSAIKDVRGVPVKMRTLFDHEELDCYVRATGNAVSAVQEFTLIRWQLAYAIEAVDNDPFEGSVEAKYSELLKWPNIIIRLCAQAYFEVYQEENDLVQSLGESLGVPNPMEFDSSLELIGSLANASDLETGQQEVQDLEEATSSLTS